MTFIELLGWVAAALVLLSFSLKTMVALRVAAIASNVVFFSYGVLADITPIMVLHGLLLPINLWRLHQIRDLLRRLRQVSRGQFSMEMLMPYLDVRHFEAGEVLFKQGDVADHLYVILQGQLQIDRAGIALERGELVGEMGLFTESQRRTSTVRCLTPVEAGRLSVEKFWQIFAQDPAFGSFLIQTIVQRFALRQADLERTIWRHTRPADIDSSAETPPA